VERAELATARELAEQLLRLAQRVQSPPLFVWAHLSMGVTLHFTGEQMSARRHLEEYLALYDPQHFRSPSAPYDPVVLGHTTLGPVLWLLGYPEQALEQSQKGLVFARTLAQPYSEIYAMNLVTRTHVLRGEPQAAHERIEELIALCREQGFASYLALSLVVQGWLLAEQGRQQEGIEQMQQQMRAWRATGAESARPYYLALLAETCGKAGEPNKGLSVLAECWLWMDKTGGHVFEAELYRMQGELTRQKFQVSNSKFQDPNTQHLTPNTLAEAEEYFHKALEIARRQEAKSLELRAAMSLAHLWHSQGNTAAARQLLEETYSWFTEGFDTKDLQDAAALLTELGGRVQEAEGRKQKAEGSRLKGERQTGDEQRETEDERRITHHVTRNIPTLSPRNSGLGTRNSELSPRNSARCCVPPGR
jgi:tetratricopeptide (TPR) repeat protein